MENQKSDGVLGQFIYNTGKNFFYREITFEDGTKD